MKKVLLVAGRECRTRLRKPVFWLLVLLVPAVLAVLYALPVLAAGKGEKPVTVLVVDETGLFDTGLRSTETLVFKPMPSLEYAKRQASDGQVLLYVPLRETTIPHDAFLLYFADEPPAAVRSALDAQLQTLLRNAILEDVYGLDASAYRSVESTYIRLHMQDAATGRQSFAAVKSVLALVLAVLMTLVLVLFGVQVARAVQEERQNRTAEVLTTSASGVQLLAGKLVGVALVALLQLTLWTVLTGVAVGGIQAAHADLFEAARMQQEKRSIATKGDAATAQYAATVELVDQAVQGLAAIRLPLVAGVFLVYFLLGYLLYGGLMAALAARPWAATGGSGWALLFVAPMAAVLLVAPLLLRGEAEALGAWLTVVPFTAPAAVVLRLPFGIPAWQAVLSLALLALAAAGAVWLAGRSYRRGLMR